MKYRTDQKDLLRRQDGGVAVIFVLLLTVMIALAAAAVDAGIWYSTRHQLINVSDSAAMAGANVLVAADSNGNPVAQAGTALTTAKNFGVLNEAYGTAVTILDQDVEMGFWDFDLKDFDPARKGPSTNPDDLTAIRVTSRRDDQANGPVETLFAGIAGINEVNITAKSTAFLGWAASMPEGEVDLPIAIKSSALKPVGSDDTDEPICGVEVTLRDENSEQGEWTTFFDSPASTPATSEYVNGKDCPALEVGDHITLNNGQLSNNIFNDLYDRFVNAPKTTYNGVEGWLVTLPVSMPGHDQTDAVVVGFCSFLITDVRPAPDKDLTGILYCDVVAPPGSISGTGNYGMRATVARLIQ